MSRRNVRITSNFDKNLVDIRRFLAGQGVPREFQFLLEQLFETVLPNLESFSEMGVDFLAKAPQSMEGLMRLETFKTASRENTSLREYISGDYLLLYALSGDNRYLLSLRHHRQLSFNFKEHWR